MKTFQELSKKPVQEVEQDILKQWEKVDILKQTIMHRKDAEPFVFFDGPATANGHPGLHHMLAKFLKDTFCKYQTMQGRKDCNCKLKKNLDFLLKPRLKIMELKPLIRSVGKVFGKTRNRSLI